VIELLHGKKVMVNYSANHNNVFLCSILILF